MPGNEQERPFYIWHYDFYLSGNAPDAFSCWEPERLAEEIVSTGVNFVVVFALNQHGYAYYPSKVAPVHPALGGRDYTGAMIDALHRRGCTVLTYVNYMNIERRREHPEWWQRQADGSEVYNEGWGVPCPNSPIREYMASVVAEVARLYPTDGFFFDMYGFNHNGCWCTNCQRKWMQRYGVPLPTGPEWGSELWRHYLDFRAECAVETMRYIRDAAKAVRKELIWVTHCGPQQNWWSGTGRLQPVVDDMVQSEVGTRRGKGLWAAGQRAKILRSFARGKAHATILADIHLYWDRPKGWFYIPWSAEGVQRQVAEIVAHGSWPSIYTEPYPDGRNNPYTVEGVRAGIMLARKFEPYLLGRETVKTVALHYSQLALDLFGREEPSDYLYSFDGAYKALMESHIPFDVVLDEQIAEGAIGQYDLVVLSNSAVTTVAMEEGLRRYVEGGGAVLATYRTSLLDEWGRQKGDFGLADILGVSYRGDFGPAYMAVDGELGAGLSSSPVIAQRLLRVAAKDGSLAAGEVIGPSPTDLAPFRYVSAPTVRTSWPAFVRRGRVLYCAADLGFAYARAGYRDHLRLLGNCVRALLGQKLPIELEAPVTVDMALYRQRGRVLLHLVNLTTNQLADDEECEADAHAVIPVCGIRVRVRRELIDPARAYCGSDGAALPLSKEGDWAVVTLPQLDIYEVVVLEG
jgi:hypothetical protein